LSEDFRWKLFFGKICPSCAGVKRKASALCKACYYALPENLRAALWSRFGWGYEQAFDEAMQFLAVKFNRRYEKP